MSKVFGDISKSRINKAGLAIRDAEAWTDELNWAFDAINSWRAFHIYPLRIEYKELLLRAHRLDQQAIVSERIKRLEAVRSKLRRPENRNMKLSAMQDIAGCRAVMPDLSDARELAALYQVSHDYVSDPKDDGYRGIHVIHRFQSDHEYGNKYNGCKTEIQIRSRLQHGWATAVETVDLVKDKKLKLGGGEDDWKHFFRLASSAIAIKEDCPQLPGTPKEKKKLASELSAMNDKLNAFEFLRRLHLSAYSAQRVHRQLRAHGNDTVVYLVMIDTREPNKLQTRVRAYMKEELQKAADDHIEIEKEYFGDPKRQVLKFGVDTVENAIPAYPAYFVDTQVFLITLQDFIAT